jgi:uncharacterized protein YdhG (YjbR/CyaY superfamily)
MATSSGGTPPASVEDYIRSFPPQTRAVLRRIRSVVRAAAPDAREVISYHMPALKGNGILIYYAAFKQHIGVYPPIWGDAKLEVAVAPYAGPKGNLRFPLAGPIPYALIARVTRHRARQDAAKRTPTTARRSARPK